MTYLYYYLKTYSLSSLMKNLSIKNFRLKKLKTSSLLYAKKLKVSKKTYKNLNKKLI